MNLVHTPLAALWVGVAFAQPVVLPTVVATTMPPFSGNACQYLFPGRPPSDAHVQLFYDVNDVPFATGTLTALAFRARAGFLATPNPPYAATLRIVLGMAAKTPSTVATTFASNQLALATAVYAGPIALPARHYPTSWPAPWETPLLFAQPFGYVKAAGQSFAIDVIQTGASGTDTWIAEWSIGDFGRRADLGGPQPSCKFSDQTYHTDVEYWPPAAGYTWFVKYMGLPPQVSGGIGAVGIHGPGGTVGGMALPIDLTPYGAPGCRWFVSMELTQGLVRNSYGNVAWPPFTLPRETALVGQAFYDQMLLYDAAANPLGWVAGTSSKWTIGPGTPLGSTLYATGPNATTAPFGTLSLAAVSVLLK